MAIAIRNYCRACLRARLRCYSLRSRDVVPEKQGPILQKRTILAFEKIDFYCGKYGHSTRSADYGSLAPKLSGYTLGPTAKGSCNESPSAFLFFFLHWLPSRLTKHTIPRWRSITSMRETPIRTLLIRSRMESNTRPTDAQEFACMETAPRSRTSINGAMGM